MAKRMLIFETGERECMVELGKPCRFSRGHFYCGLFCEELEGSQGGRKGFSLRCPQCLALPNTPDLPKRRKKYPLAKIDGPVRSFAQLAALVSDRRAVVIRGYKYPSAFVANWSGSVLDYHFANGTMKPYECKGPRRLHSPESIRAYALKKLNQRFTH